jgi:hypothetical protein
MRVSLQTTLSYVYLFACTTELRVCNSHFVLCAARCVLRAAYCVLFFTVVAV